MLHVDDREVSSNKHHHQELPMNMSELGGERLGDPELFSRMCALAVQHVENDARK